MRSFVFKFNTIPVAFKAIRCSRRAQLWHRQASIIMDLTTLAVRHGWHSLACRSYDHRRSFESIGAVHGRVMQTATKLGVNRIMLNAWLGGRYRPQRCVLARLARFLRRVGYL